MLFGLQHRYLLYRDTISHPLSTDNCGSWQRFSPHNWFFATLISNNGNKNSTLLLFYNDIQLILRLLEGFDIVREFRCRCPYPASWLEGQLDRITSTLNND
jgi:hypothetical protein